MPLMNISLWENYKLTLESLSGGRNTIVFDDQNLPSVMVRVPAFSVEDIDTDLGTGSHPAFVVNTTQKAEIMVAMYQSYVYGTRAYSLPYKDPTRSLDFDAALNDCLRKNQGDTTRRVGWHMFTNWEAAALSLLCIKNGQPTGNTNYGRHHTSKQQTGVRQDGLLPGTASGTARILTGTGPAAWRHDGTNFGVSDWVGNCWEWIDGMKISVGRFYMPDDNYYTQAEGSWAAHDVIIANDTGLKLGTTADTVHTSGTGTWCSGIGRTANYTALATAVKNKFMQAMIDPYFDTVNPIGKFLWDCAGERLPQRGGAFDDGVSAGVAAVGLDQLRTLTSAWVGFRLAYCA